jgi:hypothetical protein
MRTVIEQCAQDPNFKARLLADPRAVIGELIGVEVPESVTITIHEESLTDIHLVLANDSSALSEEDLELVSGGWNGGACQACGCIA